ncbi:MAG: rod shape-determining protein MreD [Petrimonas sp.]|jgi:rod shape-determining protein MreD|uniref:rod shape-determining protein MreD n=1 Tax=Petrimonas TaxID=307628 RepID=UPI000E8BE993|nr:rod shape-determining protein MreD [Petrimonas sp.]BBD45508.1 Rod shape-determining protein MreD [Petrimonas sp. IBARAKI]HAC74316.1 rod shape-determining protein MreD [Porphyromonadaceae bacterium]MDD4535498.1 rod shape-determining protein MreD [Petrimonas sp.]MDD4846800.1 rod shape-determining protein MreD [Petrimonas sp.]
MKAVSIFKEILLFVILVLLQVLLLNRIAVFGLAVPILYIYFLIKLPYGRNRFYVIVSGFLLGIVIDIFLNTPGMNAAATTIIATLRSMVLNLFYPKNEYEDLVPGIHTSTAAFVKFTVMMVLLHQTLLFFIEAFTLFNLTSTLIRIGSSSILTIVLILALDSLSIRREKSG